MNLSAMDLNLFLVLHAVLEEHSATGAARRLNVTQSAISNALGRLRAALGDPLVVRRGRGLVATPRAVALAPVIAEALGRLEVAVDRGRSFVPAESARTFTIAAADNHQTSEAPRIAAAFARRLPRAVLRMVSADYLAASDGLATGEIDVAFVPTPLLGDGDRGTHLFDETACLVVRRDHPEVRGKMTPRLFNRLGHIDVEVALGKPGIGHRGAEQHWRGLGLVRRVATRVPYFTTAAMVAARTDLVAGLPSRAARVLVRLLPVKIVPATFSLPSMGISMTWHERTDGDPGARYLRTLIAQAVGAAS
ncbi:MAG TPA: LysR family transcriptional regulator [Polyangia bacterium]|nr:LysR family transcriptional regulator [Polyangia bacterium]